MKYLLPHFVLVGILCLSLLIGQEDAHAHGFRAVALQIFHADSEGPQSLQLTRGFVQRTSDGTWQFVCPHFSNKTSIPKAVGSGDGDILVAGNDDLYRLRDGVVSPMNLPDFGGGKARGLGTIGETLYGVQLVPPFGSRILKLIDETQVEEIATFELPYHLQYIEGTRLYLGTVLNGVLGMTLWDTRTQSERATNTWPVPGATELISLNFVNDAYYAIIKYTDRFSLVRLQETDIVEIGTAEFFINPPVVFGDTLLTTLDGALQEIDGDQLRMLEREEYIETILELGDTRYASTPSGVYPVDVSDGTPSSVADFVFSDMTAPVLDELEGAKLEFCNEHWLDLTSDWFDNPHAGMDMSGESPDEEVPSTSEDGSCASIGSNSLGVLVLLLWGLTIFARRRQT